MPQLPSPALILTPTLRHPPSPDHRLSAAARPPHTFNPPACERRTPSPSAMSVKFEKETIEATVDAATNAATKGKDSLLHDVGEALTKGGGANGYLAVSSAPLELDK
jgi:hypothetical protein